jgi:hypothetical protein
VTGCGTIANQRELLTLHNADSEHLIIDINLLAWNDTTVINKSKVSGKISPTSCFMLKDG